MSIRQMFPGSIVKPGFNPLAAQTPSYLYNLFSWGQNANGTLGLGNRTYYSSPKQIGALTDWSKVSVGAQDTLAIKTDGTLWSWGRGSSGELGLGNTAKYSSPKQVGSLTNWSRVCAGQQESYAIKTDGTLWSWGANFRGQLGLGNTTNYSSPKQIGALTTWAWISSNGADEFFGAIRTDGTLWMWGRNDVGQLGLNNRTYYSSPKQVGALTTWSKIQVISGNTFAIKTDGTLWAWGNGSYGALGLNNRTYYSSPKQVGSLTNWLSIAAGFYGPTALKTDGTLWTWGNNSSGRLGLNVYPTSYSSPKQVGSLTTWSLISAGTNVALAIKTDGTLWTWGNNALGQLGLNSATYAYSSPKQVGSTTTWSTASTGGNFMVALG